MKTNSQVTAQEKINWVAWSDSIAKNWQAYNRERVVTNDAASFHMNTAFCISGTGDFSDVDKIFADIANNMILSVIILVAVLCICCLGGFFWHRKRKRDIE